MRWWWFAAEFTEEDIEDQLHWIKNQGFGGVEIAFIYPVNRNPDAERLEWLGKEWQERIVFTKNYCDQNKLGCDFTFGTLWPFGGTFVSDDDRTKVFGDSAFRQPLRLSWTHPDTGNVIDHLDRGAFERYAAVMGNALAPALGDGSSALFCDSWEVETRKIWTDGFEADFKKRFGYDIVPYMDDIYERGNEGPLYDYMKLVSEKVINNFYGAFTDKCHELGAYSRVQCAGSPTDLISSYGLIDVPETEAMLYNPRFSRIVSSAAALSGKPLVSAESFTCLYGWPREHMREEKITDLKLVADALFANGVNHLVWHGIPFNPKGIDTIFFYATVHAGENGSLEPHLESFNKYLTEVTALMRRGNVYSEVAVYLPVEDSWIGGEMPGELQLPWAWGEYEMRYTEFPAELEGRAPLWINREFLKKGLVENGELLVAGQRFKALYIDVKYMDMGSLRVILSLAKQSLPVCLKQVPGQAGHIKDDEFETLMEELLSLPNVLPEMGMLSATLPLVEGTGLPDQWFRKDGDTLYVFLANPAASKLKYPVPYGIADSLGTNHRSLTINYGGNQHKTDIEFRGTSSVLLKVVPGEGPVIRELRYEPGKP